VIFWTDIGECLSQILKIYVMKKMIFLSQIFIKFATENKLIMSESIEKQILN